MNEYIIREKTLVDLADAVRDVIGNGYEYIVDYISNRDNFNIDSLPEGMTAVKPYCFYNCTSLNNLTIPNTITSIGEYAFGNCTNLSRINYNGTVGEWNSINKDENWNDIDYPLYLQCADTAFCINHNYTTVIIPPTSTSTGSITHTCTICGEFYTETLINFTVTSSNRSMVGYTGAENENLVIPGIFESDGVTYMVTSIGSAAFYDCTNLALTSLPKGITSIGNHAFRGCENLALTSLPEGITSIGVNAFAGCTNLALTSLPEGITSISVNAFYGCTNLTSLTFNGTPNTIDGDAFTSCTNLTSINVPWAEGAVANAPWGATNATINYNYIVE